MHWLMGVFALVGWGAVVIKGAVWTSEAISDPWRGPAMVLWSLAWTAALAWAVTQRDSPEMDWARQVAVAAAIFVLLLLVIAV